MFRSSKGYQIKPLSQIIDELDVEIPIKNYSSIGSFTAKQFPQLIEATTVVYSEHLKRKIRLNLYNPSDVRVTNLIKFYSGWLEHREDFPNIGSINNYMEDYFGIPYKYVSIDLIAMLNRPHRLSEYYLKVRRDRKAWKVHNDSLIRQNKELEGKPTYAELDKYRDIPYVECEPEPIVYKSPEQFREELRRKLLS